MANGSYGDLKIDLIKEEVLYYIKIDNRLVFKKGKQLLLLVTR